MKKRPQLIERHIPTEYLTEKKGNLKIAGQIRENSRNLAKTKEELEKDITIRSCGEIDEVEYLTTLTTVEEIH